MERHIRYLHIPGGRIEYERIEAASAAAPTLVFLHEGLGCVSMWRDFPARLAGELEVGALWFSRIGYGRSSPCALPRPLDFMEREARTDLPEILDAAGVGPHILVGHSDGGSIALVYAAEHPRPGLLGVATLAAHVFCEELTVSTIAEAKRAYGQGDLKARLERHHGTNTDCAFWGWCDTWLDPAFLQWNLEEYLPRIGVEVLALQGRDDPYGTPAQLHAIQRGADAEARLLPECGHNPHQDRPEETIDLLAGFVRRVLRER